MRLHRKYMRDLANEESPLGRLARDQHSLRSQFLTIVPWLTLVLGALLAIPIGIFIDQHTRLDLTLLFLYFTAVGALVSGTFTIRQAMEARRATDLSLRPYLVMEGHGNAATRPQMTNSGFFATVRNHGGGLAYHVEWTSTLIQGHYEGWPPKDVFDKPFLQTSSTTHAIGAHREVRIPILSWPDGFRPPATECTLTLEFRYETLTNHEESNYQTARFDFSSLADNKRS